VRTNRFYFLMLLFFLCVLGYFTYRIMSPFFSAIAWAVVVTIIFYPAYAFISRYIKLQALASFFTVAIILIVIVGPFAYLTSVLVSEVQLIGAKITANQFGEVQAFMARLESYPFVQKMISYTGIGELASEQAMAGNVKNIGKTLIETFSVHIPDILSVVGNFIFMIFTTYFLLKDGPGFLSKAREYMPFSEAQKERLATQIKDMIVSTVYGGVLIAIIQGTLGGFAYYFLGISSPVMWGVAMSVMSFVPLLGTFIIWGPTSFYLVMQGDFIHGLELFLFGILVISMVDNILKPIIIGSRTKMPTIVILFSVLGGIKLFGVIGLITGPLVTAVFLSVFQIVSRIEAQEDAGA
jgi:predicted PurR-regulated permease PerM